jgi:hypothetical protein
MAFPYKNPITAAQLSGSESVSRTSTFGTNFSVLQTGGYMEVYILDELVWCFINWSSSTHVFNLGTATFAEPTTADDVTGTLSVPAYSATVLYLRNYGLGGSTTVDDPIYNPRE